MLKEGLSGEARGTKSGLIVCFKYLVTETLRFTGGSVEGRVRGTQSWSLIGRSDKVRHDDQKIQVYGKGSIRHYGNSLPCRRYVSDTPLHTQENFNVKERVFVLI